MRRCQKGERWGGGVAKVLVCWLGWLIDGHVGHRQHVKEIDEHVTYIHAATFDRWSRVYSNGYMDAYKPSPLFSLSPKIAFGKTPRVV